MNLKEQTIAYSVNNEEHLGYLVWDEAVSGPMPGVAVLHEWWGLNDYAKERAKAIASLGYCAFAMDLYGGGKQAERPEQAGALTEALSKDLEALADKLEAGHQTMIERGPVDPERTAAIGYCFGGGMALHMARLGLPLKAAASFHGFLGPLKKAAPGDIQARLLVCHGEQDPMVSMEDVAAFKHEMEELGADSEVIVYPEATHGFTRKSADQSAEKYGLPVGYNIAADRDSWAALERLLADSFS